MEKLSVIVPVYNAEGYLEKCIESLLVQTYKDIDIILVDDGSSDRSLSIAKKYQQIDNRVRVFHKENGGVSSARNFGILNLTTRYYCFVDADDYVSPYYCENLMDSNADYVITGLKIICDDLEKGLFGVDSKGITSIDYYFRNFYKLFQQQLTNSPWMRRYDKTISKDLLFDENQKIGEDFIFNLQYVPRCRTIEIRKKYDYFYIINDNSATGTYHDTDLSDLQKLYHVILAFTNKYCANQGECVANISFRRGGLQSIHNLYYGSLSQQEKNKELSKWLKCTEFTDSCHDVSGVSCVNRLICIECSNRRKTLLIIILLIKKQVKGFTIFLRKLLLHHNDSHANIHV